MNDTTTTPHHSRFTANDREMHRAPTPGTFWQTARTGLLSTVYLGARRGTTRVCVRCVSVCARLSAYARRAMQDLSAQWRLSTTKGDLSGERATVAALMSSHEVLYNR